MVALPVNREERAPHSALPAAIALAIGILLIGGAGPNFMLALLAVAVLVVGGLLLWRPGESPILLFIFGHQWLQGSVSIFHSNRLGIDVAKYSPLGGDQARAIVLTLTALVALALGMRFGAGEAKRRYAVRAREFALSRPVSRWFWLWVQASLVASLAQAGAWAAPGLSQILLAVSGLKWAVFLLLAYASFLRPRAGWHYFLIAFAIELVMGLGGFFSDFKTVFYFTLFAVLMAGRKVSARAVIGALSLAALLVSLGIVWTAVKGQYRTSVSSGDQIVVSDYATRMMTLSQLVGGLDQTDLLEASDAMLRRMSYVELFGAALTVVPKTVPFAHGAIFLDAVQRPFMPRLFFPDKSVIDDSERTDFYTGGLTGRSAATSISLGYVAEAYIDFGAYGMMAMIFALGGFYGWIYRLFVERRGGPSLVGMGLASAVLFGAIFLESSITKVFGAIVCSLIFAWIVYVGVVPALIRRTQALRTG